jgi:hypothetical protein
LKPYLKASGYIGPWDLNSIISKTENIPYFLEHTSRFGYSAIYCLLSLVPQGGLGNFFLNGFKFIPKVEFACSQLISIPPYPYAAPADLHKFAKGVVIDNKLENLKNFWLQDVFLGEDKKLRCCAIDANIGIMVATGDTLEDTTKSLYHDIDKLKIAADFQYRVDMLESHTKRMNKLKAWGINVW